MDSPFALLTMAALVSMAGCMLALRSAVLTRLFADIPNARSAHSSPIPRFGGLVLWLAAAGCLAWRDVNVPAPIWVLLAPALISAADDVKPVPVLTRLAVHLASALLAAWLLKATGGAFLLTALALIWLANLFNFMDGSDGFAVSAAIIHLAALALALPPGPWASVAWAVAGALAGVLVLNVPPARLFLGDAGSVPLGMLIGIVGLFGALNHHWDWWFPLMVVFPFFLDATWTVLIRLRSGKKIWIAHREHLYQQLADQGMSSRQIMRIGVLAGLCSAVAAHATHRLGGTQGMLLALVFMALLTAAYARTRSRLAERSDSDDN